jgi:polyisoprenoid-binding protein YceI
MNRNFLLILLAIAVIAGGVWFYDWVLGDTLEASQPIQAVPLDTETPTSQPASAVDGEPTPEIQPETMTSPVVEPTTALETTNLPSQAEIHYAITVGESQARFTIFEELNGVPTDVIGVTDQVAGEAAVNLTDLSQTRLGVILVNARTLATDQDRRNQAIRNRILLTDQYEFITFTPTEISGLNGSAASGQTFTFRILGDLTIRDITRPVEFEANVSVESVERLIGSASAIIRKSDFNLIVPSVPFVANVGEDVTLEIDFVLTPAGS